MEQQLKEQHLPRPWENIADGGAGRRLGPAEPGIPGAGPCVESERTDVQTSVTHRPQLRDHLPWKLLLHLPRS